jgi:hypothetical protein
MMSSTDVHALFHSCSCQDQSTIRTEVITEETNSLYGTNTETKISHII